MHYQFVQDLSLPRRYALAFIAAGSFGLLVDEDDYGGGLRKLYDHLLPGGVLVLEAETPIGAPNRNGRWFGRWWDRPDGAKNRFPRPRAVRPVRPTWKKGSASTSSGSTGGSRKPSSTTGSAASGTRTELEGELERAGFVDIAVTSVYDGLMLVVEARRP